MPLIHDLLESDKLRELQRELHEGRSALIEQLWNAPKALVAALALQATGKHLLIITGGGQEEARLYQDFAFFTDRPVVDFPAWETLPTEEIPPSPDIVGERYRTLQGLLHCQEPHIILTNLQACLQKLIPPARFKQLYLHLAKGSAIRMDALILQLQLMGYQRCAIASDKGQFAVRGGIIDLFPVSSPDPFRLEFWEDELESLRIYDPIGQKSIRHVDQMEAAPAQEMELLSKVQQLHTILDYLGPNTLIVFDDLLALEDRYATLVSMLGKASATFTGIEEFLNLSASYQRLFFTQQPIEELAEVRLSKKERASHSRRGFYSTSAPMQEIVFQMFNRELTAKRWVAPMLTIPESLFPQQEELQTLSGNDYLMSLNTLAQRDVRLHLISATEIENSNFQKRLQDAHIALPKQTVFEIGYLSNGLYLSDIQLMLFPLTEMTKHYKIRRQKQRSTYHTSPIETYDLIPGEMVVHYTHGIGKYLGIEQRPNHQGILNEFFLIEYADNAKLYVPLHQAYLISKYIGVGEEVPKMHGLGGVRWRRTRENAEKAILGYAKDLLDLYAKREIKGGFNFGEDSPLLRAFEEDFPFVETEDQLEAIINVKKDMASPKAMERLVCGDVGYGKTEVAMRAAFKAVSDGRKQVAVLVPTTVLAMQHYENFVERFRNFAINIAVLSRFRTAKENRSTIQGLKEGKIDIVIGTHRIISQDVQFKDLGLVIIDEEQRFGVRAKEHLKKIKVGVDCLTLSATPIPRTLYMSLVGARDMSIINTPPQDRLPITTMIAETHEQLLKNALLREFARDGQAFIIHNRVETIFEYAEHIQKLLPQARIVVGHGQMSADELDTVFHTFKNGHADILISTTIVENGIDIPNANTILIDRADRFGMADLYQLRGRVGRWNRRAYAYFLVPNQRILPEIVRKRLQALMGSSGYGGGMKVAMRDLELRGAGNILGTEQSGQISSIGFHLYCKLLKRTMRTLQGKENVGITDSKVEFPVDARLPVEYVNEVSLRMEIYQRFGDALSCEEAAQIWEELQDRFGPPPDPARWLYHLTRIRIFAAQKSISLLKLEKGVLLIEAEKKKLKVPLSKLLSPDKMEAQVIALLKGPEAKGP
jgi:transcription-repair coupling factor (superfamily II helicase)